MSTLWKFVVTSGCCHLPNSDGCGSILNLLIYRYCLDSNEINSKNLNVIQPYVGKNSPFIKSSNLFSFFNPIQIKFLILSYTLGEAGAEGLSVLFICLKSSYIRYCWCFFFVGCRDQLQLFYLPSVCSCDSNSLCTDTVFVIY